jgi:hypothetical protein
MNWSEVPTLAAIAYEGKITFYGIYEVKGDELRVCGDGADTATEKNPEARCPKKTTARKACCLSSSGRRTRNRSAPGGGDL